MTVPVYVTVLGIAGTWIIALAAIFGEKVRPYLFRPKLQIRLESKTGELIKRTVSLERSGESAEHRNISTRYFHLRVTNKALFPIATEVEALLLQLDKRDLQGLPQRQWSGRLPLDWQYRLYPRARTVGRSTQALAELFYIDQDRGFKVLLSHTPDHEAFGHGIGEQHVWLTVQASGLNGESALLRLKIDWDGIWEREDDRIGQHLQITPDPL